MQYAARLESTISVRRIVKFEPVTPQSVVALFRSPHAYFPAGQPPLLHAGYCTPLSINESCTLNPAPPDCTIEPFR